MPGSAEQQSAPTASQPLQQTANANDVAARLEPRRQEALGYLRRHIHDGDLTLEEYGVRVERVLTAQTSGEVLQAVEGLPALADPALQRIQQPSARSGGERVSPMGQAYVEGPTFEPLRSATSEVRSDARSNVLSDVGSAPSASSITSVFADAKLAGRWRASEEVVVKVLFGSGKIDLREAIITSDRIAIIGSVVFGNLEIIVPPGTPIDVSGTVIFGDRKVEQDNGRPLPGMPAVHIDATVVFGDVRVRFRELGESKFRKLRRSKSKKV
jgi:Cell wall-active antibiotics response 4TMS YvqF/Domain of unknown function (DUF1707)